MIDQIPKLKFLSQFFAMPGVADMLIAKSKENPYFDLTHADGSLYMGRDWIHQYSNETEFGSRVHHLATPDIDRHLHDHPWDFVSIVLKGGYTEIRPAVGMAGEWDEDGAEPTYPTVRTVGDIAFRRAEDRHRIISVEPDTYTLCITGPKKKSWGFYTPEGFKGWRDYCSVHGSEP